MTDALLDQLRRHVGATGTPKTARDAVSLPVIRTWCDAMSEANPLFVDSDAAEAGPHGGLVAPPAMLNAWTMTGLHMGAPPPRDAADPSAAVYQMLTDAGYPGVVATNSDQVYHRYLRPGDVLTGTTKLVEVSDEKTTGLGTGYFVTTETEYVDQAGDPVGSLFFRVLRFKPGTGRSKPVDPRRQALIDAGLDPDELLAESTRPNRPAPTYNQDQAWFWEGLKARELRIQRFPGTGTLIHPPANSNPESGSFDYDWVVASGQASLYSWAAPHYPQVPAFDYPLIVGLVELEEGVRMVSNIVGCTRDDLEIGMPLELCWLDTPDGHTLHQFRPATPARRAETRVPGSLAVGERLPLCAIPLDPLLIVSTALATRDYQDVHHNRDAALQKGSKDIFMNILTSSGLVTRWIGDWAGPNVVFHDLKVRLGAPNYPYDTMTFSGQVAEAHDDGSVTVTYQGQNSLGSHMSGSATLSFAGQH